MGKIVSLLERMEVWSPSYVSPEGDLRVMVSNHGRMKFFTKQGDNTCLEFVESVGMLSRLSKDMDTAMGILYEK